MTLEETLDARRGTSSDPRIDAMLAFATGVVTSRGQVGDELLERVKAQGFSDEEIVEAIGMIGLATLSNYVANVGRPDLDYLDAPEIE
jgi:alkylhydroperoxidase family enzyme